MPFSTRIIYAGTVGYCNAVGYAAVGTRINSTNYKVGRIVRQTVALLNEERCFVCVTAGLSGTTEPTWVITRGGKTTDGGVTWQECTGAPAVNGDLVNTPTWAFTVGYLIARKIAIGQTIKFTNKDTGDISYQICTTAGTAGSSEPTFSKEAGTVISDGTVKWTSLGLAETFVGGGAPHARITNAGVEHWFYGGGTIFVGDDHAESQSGDLTFKTIYQSTDPILMSMMLCHDHAGNYPPTANDLRSSAVVSTADRIYWYPSGSFYAHGVTFKAGDYIILRPLGAPDSIFSPGPNRQNWTLFDACSFWLDTNLIVLGESYVFGSRTNCYIIFNNTKVYTKNTGVLFLPYYARFLWRNTLLVLESGSAVPGILISTRGIDDCVYDFIFEACDLSQLDKKLSFTDFWQQASLVVKDCKMHPAATFDLVPEDVGMVVQTARCDSGIATYQSDKYVYEGRDSTEIVIIREGGAIDPNGQPQTRRLTALYGATWLRPLQASPYAIWNSVVGAPVHLTVYGLASSDTPVMNDDIWLEIEYLADPDSMLGTIVTTTKASVISAGAAVNTDSSKWNNVNSVMFDYVQGYTDVFHYATLWLSEGNRVATLDYTGTINGAGGARSLAFRSSGKYYFEIKVLHNDGASSNVGVMASTDNLSGSTHGITVRLNDGRIFVGTFGSIKFVGAFVAGDVAGIAVDVGHRGWIRRNNGLWNGDSAANPATGIGGLLLTANVDVSPAVYLNGSAGNAVVLNCGWDPFVAPLPSTFDNWPPVATKWSPFKLTTTVIPGRVGYVNVRPMVGKPNATFFLDPQIIVT